jgi:hypothetical protein
VAGDTSSGVQREAPHSSRWRTIKSSCVRKKFEDDKQRAARLRQSQWRYRQKQRTKARAKRRAERKQVIDDVVRAWREVHAERQRELGRIVYALKRDEINDRRSARQLGWLTAGKSATQRMIARSFESSLSGASDASHCASQCPAIAAS